MLINLKKRIEKIKVYFIRLAFPNYILSKSKELIRKGDHQTVIKLLEETLKIHPKHYEMNKLIAGLYTDQQNWVKAIQYYECIIEDGFTNQEKTLLIRLSMIYQIIGEHEKAERIFNSAIQNRNNSSEKKKKVHEKIILFDNGETRIEFYKRLNKTSRIVMTFDSINMEWNGSSFSFKVLEQEDLDIIAVRKREKETYQQDLSQLEFVNTVSSLVSNYDDKVSYGFSLGAYNALYFSSLLNFRIYAISPRISIHPVYGRTKVINQHQFHHKKSFDYNDEIRPIIVYDPKNSLDFNFVNKEVLRAFPHSSIIKTPYSGHGVAPFLLKNGQLKEFILKILKGETPKYNRKNKGKSIVYLMNLAKECLKRNKFNWALKLSNKCLQLDPLNKEAVKIKGQALLGLDKKKDAYKFLKEKIGQAPGILTFRNILIDLYLKSNEVSLAEETIGEAFANFGNRPSLIKRKKSIELNANIRDSNN